MLTLINFITNNPRISLDSIKAFAAFLGMIIMVQVIAQVTECMYLFPQPFHWHKFPEGLCAIFLWLEVEWAVWLGTLFSYVIFIAIRTQVRHKL